jgi:hypothetical protein
MNETAAEINRYRKDARVRQVSCIIDKAFKNTEFGIGNIEKEFQRFEILLFTPPVLLDSQIKEFGEVKETFYSKASIALRHIMVNSITIVNLEMLLRACEEEVMNTQLVAIDHEGHPVLELVHPSALLAFKSREELLNNLALEAVKLASAQTLDLIEGECPLMRYRYDLARQKTPNFLEADRGQIWKIPTKVEGVDLELCYQSEKELPRMFLSVSPLNL